MVQSRLENPLTDGFIGEMEEVIPDQMAIRRAVIEETNEEFYIVQVNPWQLWEVRNKKGKTPLELDQRFTSDRKAQVALEQYVTKREEKKAEAAQVERLRLDQVKEQYDRMRAKEKANDELVAEINAAKEFQKKTKKNA